MKLQALQAYLPVKLIISFIYEDLHVLAVPNKQPG